MRKELAQVVFPLFTFALHLKEEVQRGKSPNDLSDAQHKLSVFLDDVRAVSAGDERVENALVYWLDEIFIDSDWNRDNVWEQNRLGLIRKRGGRGIDLDNLRATAFWNQAEQPDLSAETLEIHFLCVVLGFRGRRRNSPVEVKQWANRTVGRLKQFGTDWAPPPPTAPQGDALPLFGTVNLKKALIALSVSVLIWIPLVILLVFLAPRFLSE